MAAAIAPNHDTTRSQSKLPPGTQLPCHSRRESALAVALALALAPTAPAITRKLSSRPEQDSSIVLLRSRDLLLLLRLLLRLSCETEASSARRPHSRPDAPVHPGAIPSATVSKSKDSEPDSTAAQSSPDLSAERLPSATPDPATTTLHRPSGDLPASPTASSQSRGRD